MQMRRQEITLVDKELLYNEIIKANQNKKMVCMLV